MNSKVKWVLRGIFAALCAIVVTVAAYIVGYALFPQNDNIWGSLSIVCFVALILWIVLNFVAARAIKKKYESMDPRQAYDFGIKKQQEIESDYKTAEKKTRKSLNNCYFALAALMILLALFLLFLGALRAEWYMVPVIFICFVYCACFDLIFTTDTPSAEDRRFELREGEYPVIYATAKLAADKVGCKRKIVIEMTGEGIGVSEGRNCVYLLLNAMECSLLTRDELYNVLLHEFAHVSNVDTVRSRRFYCGKLRWGGDDKMFWSWILPLFTSSLVQTFGIDVTFYELMATRHHERLADAKVKELGDRQHFINAVSKGAMFARFDALPRREIAYDLYEAEEPPKDYYSRYIALFHKCRESEGERWKEILKKELPARVASHPTLRQRMEAMEVDSYDDTTEETDEKVLAEYAKLIKFSDDELYNLIKRDYKNIREGRYVKRKEQMDKYLKAKEEGKTLPPDELVSCMDAFLGIDDDVTLEIADQLLAKDNGYAYAHLYRAQVYFNRYDARCVEEFRAAMRENGGLCETCLDGIGQFALLSGDENLLKEYRSSAPETAISAQKEAESSMWRVGIPLSKCTLDASALDDIGNRIAELGEGVIKCGYAADFGEGHIAIVVQFYPNMSPTIVGEKLNDIFCYLDSRPEDFWLSRYYGAIATAIKRAGIEPFYQREKK